MSAKKAVDYAGIVRKNQAAMQRQVKGEPPQAEPEAVVNEVADAKRRTNDAEKVGLNLRITKDRRAFIKSWSALHDIAMNDLFSDIIDQVRDGEYNPLK